MSDLSVPLEYFAKRAKRLRSCVQACDHLAVSRVRAVFTDASAMSDPELAADFGLMRAQHVVAVEHGFPNWKALTESSEIEARLAITMARLPELNDFGIGIGGWDRDKSAEQQSAILARNRETLRASATAVANTVSWLRERVTPTRAANERRTSYGIKHVAEQDLGYVTNGVFVAAAIIAGYRHELIPGSPNVRFGMSEKSLEDIAVEGRFPERTLRRFMPRAIDVLAKRGIRASPVGRSGVELAWLDDGDVRTLRIGTAATSPFIVRLHVDHYSLMVSTRVAKLLGVTGGHYAQACPTRPKGEISVLPDEVDSALEGALTFDARTDAEPAPPFEVAGYDGWSYVWSERAADRYASRHHAPASA